MTFSFVSDISSSALSFIRSFAVLLQVEAKSIAVDGDSSKQARIQALLDSFAHLPGDSFKWNDYLLLLITFFPIHFLDKTAADVSPAQSTILED